MTLNFLITLSLVETESAFLDYLYSLSDDPNSVSEPSDFISCHSADNARNGNGEIDFEERFFCLFVG